MAKVEKNAVKIFVALLPFIAVLSALCAAVGVFFASKTVSCDTAFYYVCYKTPQTDSSTTAVSDLVHSYGGAGYVATVDGECFVVVSCYYSQADADKVAKRLSERGLSCVSRSVSVPRRKVFGSAKNNVTKYEGNLKTLVSVSRTCYDLANALDDLSIGQEGARNIIAEIKSVLNGLAGANIGNCFERELTYLLAECDDLAYGYVFSYNVRRLQVAVCDAVVNANIN